MDDSTRPNRISSVILFAVVALSPFPFGSVDLSTISFWCVLLGIAVIFAVPSSRHRAYFALLGFAGVVVAGYAFVLIEQLAAHPWLNVADPLWSKAAEVLAAPLQPAASIARFQPYYALGGALLSVLSLTCAFVVCADRTRAHQLLRVMAWAGVAYAVFGIISFLSEPTKILWREKQAYTNVLTSTFINRNTAAVYFGSCSILWLLFLSEKIKERFGKGKIYWALVPSQLLSHKSQGLLVPFIMLFVTLAAMAMTASRAGVVLSLLMLVLAFAVFFHRDLARSGRVVASVAALTVGAFVLLQIIGTGVTNRFDTEGFAGGGRLGGYRSTIEMIADHPWFGTGLGTFPWGFPAYRSADISLWGTWTRAHNTLLEIAAELGIPLAILVVTGWIIAFAVLIHGAFTRRRSLITPVAGLCVGGLGVLHSLVDFSLQIPGYAIGAFALIGAGLAQSLRTPQPEGGNNGHTGVRRSRFTGKPRQVSTRELSHSAG